MQAIGIDLYIRKAQFDSLKNYSHLNFKKMKKIIMLLLSGVVYASCFTNNAAAQKATHISFPHPKTVNTGADEGIKADANNNVLDPVDKATIKAIKADLRAAKANLKITKDLNKNFTDVSDLAFNSEGKIIVATFKMKNKSARVVYDKKGNQLYTIINYQEDQLAENIRSLVMANYKSFAITLVQEVTQGNVHLYKVFLEDSKRLKQILVCDNEIIVYRDFSKNR